MPAPRCDQTPAWDTLRLLFNSNKPNGYKGNLAKTLQKSDLNWRGAALRIEAPHVHGDLSKSATDRTVLDTLLALFEQRGVAAQRDAMFAGQAINATEGRAVMHWLVRQPAQVLQSIISGKNPLLAQVSIDVVAPEKIAIAAQEVLTQREAFFAAAEAIRADALAGKVTDVVNIGIGGSDLGPAMATQALSNVASQMPRMHFVSNVDPFALEQSLKACDPQFTRFIVQSKTFSTVETRLNAQASVAWLKAGGVLDVSDHLLGVSVNAEAARALGCGTVLPLWDWVGGRYSVWSAIGAPLAVAIGRANFEAFLQGAADMDAHFAHAPPERNLPVLLGLQDVLYRNFLGYTSRCVAPYAQALARLPAYLQQLEMESNGKRVDANGHALPFHTSAVIWGEPGTNGQHAYFQQLHQGTEVIPVEIIAVKAPMASGPQAAAQQQTLLANAIAQAQALMEGQASADGHRHFEGGRPSNFLLLNALSPKSLGALIALYEHRVFVAGSIWGINSFDQFGVELGKVLATDIEARLQSGNVSGLDASTASLIQRIRS